MALTGWMIAGFRWGLQKIVGSEDCRVVVDVEDCRVGGSHMELCLETILYVRCMYGSLKLQSQSLSNFQIVEQIAQIDHSVKADVCRTANHVDADNRKRV